MKEDTETCCVVCEPEDVERGECKFDFACACHEDDKEED